MKAKVFLSCGQNKSSDEPQVAGRVAEKIDQLGFDCWMAVEVQNLRSLRESIFEQLQDTDYLVFVDFKREELKHSLDTHRGSLFANQELAIASFLEIPVLAFQEKGVRPLDGMLGAFHCNVTEFSDRGSLPDRVAAGIRAKLSGEEWSNQTRNLLTLEHRPPVDRTRPDGALLRLFHVTVRNNHHRKGALNCFVYLDSAVKLDSNLQIPLETIEFKWAGTELPSVRIRPQSFRVFDALWFKHGNPVELGFGAVTDSADSYPRLRGPGRYHLTYSVACENFVEATKMFTLEYGESIDTVKFTEA